MIHAIDFIIFILFIEGPNRNKTKMNVGCINRYNNQVLFTFSFLHLNSHLKEKMKIEKNVVEKKMLHGK